MFTKTIFILIAALVITPFASAMEVKGVKMDDEITVDGKKLFLNGMGIREVTKFGMPFKVYVAGLYLEKKDSDSEAILKSTGIKRIVTEYLLKVDRDANLEGYRNTYKANCWQDCEKASEQFKPFGAEIISVREKDRMQFTYFKDRVDFEVIGTSNKKVSLPGEALSTNLLATFINSKSPPTPELRKGILGEKR